MYLGIVSIKLIIIINILTLIFVEDIHQSHSYTIVILVAWTVRTSVDIVKRSRSNLCNGILVNFTRTNSPTATVITNAVADFSKRKDGGALSGFNPPLSVHRLIQWIAVLKLMLWSPSSRVK